MDTEVGKYISTTFRPVSIIRKRKGKHERELRDERAQTGNQWKWQT